MQPQTQGLVLAGVLLTVAAALGIRFYLRRRPDAAELERRRRDLVNRDGKLGNGEIVDVDGVLIVYSYSVAGVGYTTSQDAAAIEALLPADRMSMVGPVSVKFLPRNPTNSIVLCEGWSGARIHSRV